jgi:hypothetical protein
MIEAHKVPDLGMNGEAVPYLLFNRPLTLSGS